MLEFIDFLVTLASLGGSKKKEKRQLVTEADFDTNLKAAQSYLKRSLGGRDLGYLVPEKTKARFSNGFYLDHLFALCDNKAGRPTAFKVKVVETFSNEPVKLVSRDVTLIKKTWHGYTKTNADEIRKALT